VQSERRGSGAVHISVIPVAHTEDNTMSGTYKIHVTASKWVEAYIDLKNRIGTEPTPIREPAPLRSGKGKRNIPQFDSGRPLGHG
jgi:hypothetical protein